MKTKKIACSMLMMLALSSCSIPKENNNQLIIKIGTTANIESAKRSDYQFDVLSGVTSQLALVSLNENGEYEPQLTNFSTSDNKTYTFTVVEGMKWHDGNKVTAEDILYTLQYQDNYGNGHNFKDVTGDDGKVTTKKYENYEISDDKMTISLTLVTPNVRELSNLVTLRVMPKHLYEGKEETISDSDSLVGCGPYKFESFDRDSNTLVFTKFDDCPIKVKPNKLIFTLYKDDNILYKAMDKGTIDTVYQYSTGLSKEGVKALSDNKNVILKSISAKNTPAVLTFNNDYELFKDLNVKNAIAYALEYEIYKMQFGNQSDNTPSRSFIPSSSEFAIKTATLETNLEKANQYLVQSGYSKKEGDKYYKKGNETLGFTLTAKIEKTGLHARYADAVKTSLEKFGISVTVEMLEKSQYDAKTANKFSNNNITHQAAIFGYTPFGLNSGAGFGSIYMDATHSVQGGGQIKDEKFKEIISKLEGSLNIEQYKENAKLIQKYYEENIPAISLYEANTTYAFSSKFKGYTIDSTFGILNYNTWVNIEQK